MHRNTILKKLVAWIATGALIVAISGPFPFSAKAVVTGKVQDKDKEPKSDKSKSKNKSTGKDKIRAAAIPVTVAVRNDGSNAALIRHKRAVEGSTQHDNPPE